MQTVDNRTAGPKTTTSIYSPKIRRRVTEVTEIQEFKHHTVKKYTGRNPYIKSMPCIHTFVIEQHRQRPYFTWRLHKYFFSQKRQKRAYQAACACIQTQQSSHTKWELENKIKQKLEWQEKRRPRGGHYEVGGRRGELWGGRVGRLGCRWHVWKREEEEKREGEVQTQVWRPVVFSLSNHPNEPTYSYLFLTGI